MMISYLDQFKNRRHQQRLSPSFCYPWLKMVFRRLKICFLICALASFVFVLLFGYLCPPSICYMRARVYEKYYLSDAVKNVYRSVHSYVSSVIDEYPEHVIRNDYRVNLHKEDVLVFLHIQKTGGTYLGKHLVRNLLIGQPCVCPPHVRRCHCDPAEDTMQLRSPSEFTCKCRKGKKKCTCLNGDGNIWLFSRYSTGWACGLHADWTELKSCVEHKMDKKEHGHRKRNYHFITILRDPMQRYVSEWKHVQRGATWRRVMLKCNGRSATETEWPSCYDGVDWNGVSLAEFAACRFNLANNRQVRMMANLSLVGCYNLSAMAPPQRAQIMLRSARRNLEDMAFLGLNEHQIYTQYLFHRTFGLFFREIFEQRNVTHSTLEALPPKLLKLVQRVNDLDLQFYDFARELFIKRLQHTVIRDRLVPQSWKRRLEGFKTRDYLLHEQEVAAMLIPVLKSHGSRRITAQERARRDRRWKEKLKMDQIT